MALGLLLGFMCLGLFGFGLYVLFGIVIIYAGPGKNWALQQVFGRVGCELQILVILANASGQILRQSAKATNSVEQDSLPAPFYR